MEILGYAAAVAIGITLGLMGGGGSILTVPVLVYLFGESASKATGDSLFIVGATAAIGAVLMARRGLVDTSAALRFALPAFLTVWLTRHFLLPALPEKLGMLSRDTALLVLLRLSCSPRQSRNGSRAPRPLSSEYPASYQNGAPDRSRTCDLWLRKPTLYPAELRARGRAFYRAPRTSVQPRYNVALFPSGR